MLYLKISLYVCVHIKASQKAKGALMRSLKHYFHIKTKILTNFQICISVPLILFKLVKDNFRLRRT